MKPAIVIETVFTGDIQEFFEENCDPMLESVRLFLKNRKVRIELIPIE